MFLTKVVEKIKKQFFFHNLHVQHHRCVYNKLKTQVSSVKTQLCYLMHQPHVSAPVSGHHQANPKNINK
jgi:hypothetical protein